MEIKVSNKVCKINNNNSCSQHLISAHCLKCLTCIFLFNLYRSPIIFFIPNKDMEAKKDQVNTDCALLFLNGVSCSGLRLSELSSKEEPQKPQRNTLQYFEYFVAPSSPRVIHNQSHAGYKGANLTHYLHKPPDRKTCFSQEKGSLPFVTYREMERIVQCAL